METVTSKGKKKNPKYLKALGWEYQTAVTDTK